MARIGSTRRTAGAVAVSGSFQQGVRGGGLPGISNRGAAFAGLGQAIAGAATDVADEIRKQEEEVLTFDAMKKYGAFRTALTEQLAELENTVGPDGAGLTDQGRRIFQERSTEFMESIAPSVRDKFQARVINDQINITQTLINSELTLRENDAVRYFEDWMNAQTSSFLSDPTSAPRVLAQGSEILETMPIPSARREELRRVMERSVGVTAVTAALLEPTQFQSVMPDSPIVDNVIVPAIIGVESAGKFDAVSKAGASGLMQLMPGTAEETARGLGMKDFPYGASDDAIRAWLTREDNQEQNILLGTTYFKQQLRRYGGDLEAALAAYNGGPGRADRFVAAGKDYSTLPSETRAYVPKVMARMGVPTSQTYSAAPPSRAAIVRLGAEFHLPPQMTLQLVRAAEARADEIEKENVARLGSELERIGAQYTVGQIELDAAQAAIRQEIGSAPLSEEEKAPLLAEALTSLAASETFRPVVQEYLEETGLDVMGMEPEEIVETARVHRTEIARQQTEAKKRADAEKEAYLESVRAAIRQKSPAARNLINKAVSDGFVRRGDDDYASLVDLYEEEFKTEIALTEVMEATGAGRQLRIDQKPVRDNIDLLYRENLLILDQQPTPGMGEDERQALAVAQREAFANIMAVTKVQGVITPSVERWVGRKLGSPDFQTISSGVQFLNQLRAANAEAYNAWASDGAGLAADSRRLLWEAATEYNLATEQKVALVSGFRDTKMEGDLAARMELADEELKAVTTAEIVDGLRPWFAGLFEGELLDVPGAIADATMRLSFPGAFGGQLRLAKMDFNPGVHRQLRTDYENLYRLYRQIAPTESEAQALASEQMSKMYGEWKGVMMKRPPHLMYEKVGSGGHDYIDRQVREELPIASGTDYRLYHFDNHSRMMKATGETRPYYTVSMIADRDRAVEIRDSTDDPIVRAEMERIISEMGETQRMEVSVANWKPDPMAAALALSDEVKDEREVPFTFATPFNPR